MSHDPGAPDDGSIPSHPLVEGLLGRPGDRRGPCKRLPCGGSGRGRLPTSEILSYPWAGDKRAEAKTAVFRWFANADGGAPLSTIVRDVFDESAGNYDSADYQLVRRFVQNSELFTVRRARGLLWVERSLDGLSLTHSMQSAEKQASLSADGGPSGGRDARATARARLSRLSRLDDGPRAELLGDLAARRSGREGRFLTFRRRSEAVGDESNYLMVPLESRFSSAERSRDAYRTYAEAWDRASGRHNRGVVLTLTTDPGRFDSIADASSSLMDDVEQLRSWLAYDPERGPARPGERLESIVVPEFTDSGLPHAHIVFFGASWLTPVETLRGYCSEKLDRCSVVWCDRIHRRGGASASWAWENDPDRELPEGRSPKAYLAEPLEARREAALATPDELKEASAALAAHGLDEPIEKATDSPTERSDLRLGRRCWRAALYFATDLRFYTLSPSLRGPADPDEPSEWELARIATWAELPRHVVGDAEVIGAARPPPTLAVGTDAGPA